MLCNSTHTYVVCDQGQQYHSNKQTCPIHDNDGAILCKEKLSVTKNTWNEILQTLEQSMY